MSSLTATISPIKGITNDTARVLTDATKTVKKEKQTIH